MVKIWASLSLAGLLAFSACEDRCGKDQNVGGGTAGLEIAAHLRVARPAAIFGSEHAAHHEVAELFGVDAYIVEQTEGAMPVDVLVGVGDSGVEVHTAMVAAGDAKERLAERYVLEPMMFQQLRIKPLHDRTRCMLFNAHVACATGDARLGRGVIAVERLATQGDAGTEHALIGRVVTPTGFIDRVVPLVRRHLEASLTRAKAPATIRALVLDRDWNEIARWLAGAELNGEMRGENLVLVTTLPFALPEVWKESAPRLTGASSEVVALTWRQDEPSGPEALRPTLGTGRATALIGRDGGRIELYEVRDREAAQGALAKPSTPRMSLAGGVLSVGEAAVALDLEPADDHAVARVVFDAALVGGAGTVTTRVFRDGERARLEVEMTRPAFLAVLRALSASFPDEDGQ